MLTFCHGLRLHTESDFTQPNQSADTPSFYPSSLFVSPLLSSAVLCLWLWLALNCKICAIFNFIKLLRAVFCLCCFTLVENPPRTLNYDYRKHIHTPTYTHTNTLGQTYTHTWGVCRVQRTDAATHSSAVN